MNTFLLTILVGNIVLEAICAYLIYRRRYQLLALLQQYLGTVRLEAQLDSVNKKLRFIRKSQKLRDAQDAEIARQRALDSNEPVRKVLRQSDGQALIEAIKTYRNIHSASLLEAKNAVEAMRDRLRERGEIA